MSLKPKRKCPYVVISTNLRTFFIDRNISGENYMSTYCTHTTTLQITVSNGTLRLHIIHMSSENSGQKITKSMTSESGTTDLDSKTVSWVIFFFFLLGDWILYNLIVEEAGSVAPELSQNAFRSFQWTLQIAIDNEVSPVEKNIFRIWFHSSLGFRSSN